MIDTLSGRIKALQPELLLDLGPLVLRLEISERTRSALPGPGAAATVYAEFRLREELPELIGFATADERRIYRLLTGISGVGKRLALAILSELGVAELAQAVAIKDEKRLTKISGVGAKTASRLLLELGSKLDEFLPAEELEPIMRSAEDPRREEALLALTALGLSKSAALEALARVGDGKLGVEEMIREALKTQGKT